MEKISESVLDFENVNNLVENEFMWKKFDDYVKRVKKGKNVDIEGLKFCVCAVYLSCKLKSAQRPGAASSITIDEYQ